MAVNMSNVKQIMHNNKEVIKIEDSSGHIIWQKVQLVSLDYITIRRYKTRLHTGEEFVFGGTVTAFYTDGTNAVVTSSATFSGYDMSTAGTYDVTVSYTENGVTRTASYSLVVADITTATINIIAGEGQDIATTQYYNRIALPSTSGIRSAVARKIGASSNDVNVTKIELDLSTLYWYNPYSEERHPTFSLTTNTSSTFGSGTVIKGSGRYNWDTYRLNITDKVSSAGRMTYFYGYNWKSYSSNYNAFSNSSSSGSRFCTRSSSSTKPTFTIVVTYEY